MPNVEDKILALSRQLYPTGRAFKMPVGGNFEKLHKVMAVDQSKAYNDALSVFNSLIPDNSEFNVSDADKWEYTLGIISDPSLDLDIRKQTIFRKMVQLVRKRAKGHYLHIQQQLQLAGFGVYVHENIPYQDPNYILHIEGLGTHGEVEHGEVEHGDPFSYNSDLFEFVQHGDLQHGEFEHGDFSFKHKVVNSLDRDIDAAFLEGANYKSVIFIGGQVKGTFANVDTKRELQFRQLILNLKHTQIVAYLLINYI
jgi:hypothetical protein